MAPRPLQNGHVGRSWSQVEAKWWKPGEGQVVEAVAQVGGGSLPGGDVPSFAVKLSPDDPSELQKLQTALRGAATPIIVRLEKGSAYLDFRSLPASDDQELSEGFRRVFT